MKTISFINLKEYQYIGAILLMSIILIILVLQSGSELRFQDEGDYLALAKTVSEGKGYINAVGEPTAFRPPMYPVILAGLIKAGVTIPGLKFLNIIFLLVVTLTLTKIIEGVSDKAARWVPWLVMANPVVLYASTTLYPQIFGSMLFVLGLYWLIHSRLSTTYAILGGCCWGGLILTIPSFLMNLIIVPILYLWLTCNIKWTNMKPLVVFVAVALLVVSVWSVRNYRLFHEFIPVSTNGGLNFLKGNSENTTGNSGVNVDISNYQLTAINYNEIERDRYFKKIAWGWIFENPYRAGRLYLWKTINYFNCQLNLRENDQESQFRNGLIWGSYAILMSCVLIGMLRKEGVSSVERFAFWVYITNAFLAAIFFTRIRFRIPFDIAIIICAAPGLQTLIENSPWKRGLKK